MSIRQESTTAGRVPVLADWRRELLSRRRFLMALAGGSLAALLPLPASAAAGPTLDEAQRWVVLGAVQEHLFPSEPEAPGAREINALGYLRFVVADENLDLEERAFILQGAEWLEALTRERQGRGFVGLDGEAREQMLRAVARSEAGENWLSTLLVYIFEALLTDPVYGGNTGGVGWKWLGHIPGFPRPTPGKRYGLG